MEAYDALATDTAVPSQQGTRRILFEIITGAVGDKEQKTENTYSLSDAGGCRLASRAGCKQRAAESATRGAGRNWGRRINFATGLACNRWGMINAFPRNSRNFFHLLGAANWFR